MRDLVTKISTQIQFLQINGLLYKKSKKQMKGVSLFSSAGIAETYFAQVGIDIVAANELIAERANLYSSVYKNSAMVSGNILDKNVFKRIVETSGKKIDFLIASPPCQGMSMAGKSRNAKQFIGDERNFLIFKVIVCQL